MTQEQKKAPEFSLLNQDDQTRSLSDFAGKRLIVYFYPKDNTSGCTKQAIAFSENKQAFDKLNVHIIGISKDSTRSHKSFETKQNLSVELLSDPETTVQQSYGVWKEKSMYGRKYMGTERSTFLISADGIIEKVWQKVKVNGHIEDILSYLNQNPNPA